MKIINELNLKIGKDKKIIYFGIPDNAEELNKMFSLRYDVYKNNKYFNPSIKYGPIDKDEYDLENKCFYFIAKIDGKIIGTIRAIKDNILPIESYCFKFEEPDAIKIIPRNERVELGRLVVVPPGEKQYLPRNIVLLFLIKSAVNFLQEKNINGGYAFVTKKLYNKLSKLKVPFCSIEKYTQIYPQSGLLYPYFNKKDNPIYPIFYLRKDLEKYFSKIFNKKKLVKEIDKNKFVLIDSLYNNFLRLLNII